MIVLLRFQLQQRSDAEHDSSHNSTSRMQHAARVHCDQVSCTSWLRPSAGICRGSWAALFAMTTALPKTIDANPIRVASARSQRSGAHSIQVVGPTPTCLTGSP